MRGDTDEALALYAKVVAKLPSPEFIAPYAEVAKAAGETATFERQLALMGAIGQLFEANGIRNDLTLILFELDHGDAAAALPKAEAAYRERPSLAASDTYGWALYRAGRFDEAQQYADEALSLGTKEPQYLYHAGMIAAARGDAVGARERLQAALALNAEFHPLFADGARAELKKVEADR
jgi:tetratricopeptide (TPR) repeat protein